MNQSPARLLGAVSVAVLVGLTASGCNNQDPTGISGTVTDRDQRHDPATKASAFYLTISGTEYKVSYDTYSHCFHGSHYPACKH